MLRTIEVEIDDQGCIHPLEVFATIPSGRGYLTLLPAVDQSLAPEIQKTNVTKGSAAQALALLASPRFAQRPIASAAAVQQRIDELRNDWGSL